MNPKLNKSALLVRRDRRWMQGIIDRAIAQASTSQAGANPGNVSKPPGHG